MFRWGIIGAGNIGAKFAAALNGMRGAKMRAYAVCSRNEERTREFALKHRIACVYTEIPELLADASIDAVYIATPHPSHYAIAVAAIKAGKHILCEKPMGMDSEEVVALIDLAREKKVFLMENMWTRLLPVTRQVMDWIEQGEIGEVRFLYASYEANMPNDENLRWMNKSLGGGALMDVGIYPINYAAMLFGYEIDEILSTAHFTRTGVDAQHSIILKYKEGTQMANLSCGMGSHRRVSAIITGSKGNISVDNFTRAESAVLQRVDGTGTIIDIPHEVNGFEYSIREAYNCIMAGDLESSSIPLEVTFGNIRIMDHIRRQWGLEYK